MMQRRRNQVSIAVVTFVLGLLVIVQLRAQTVGSPLVQLSSQDLTVLVANLNGRNDALRREVATLERSLETLTANEDRGEISLDDLRAELGRVRAYAGVDPVVGSGVSVTISGPIDGSGLEGLINELRNAGAEAIAVAGIRAVPSLVAEGFPGEVTLDGSPLGETVELAAIGAPDKLTGSLTRSGGVIAQLAATQPDVVVTVTPMERLELPASDRGLVPAHGHPRL
jgi:uncharacterized protein YlxW (UPF0749 family)